MVGKGAFWGDWSKVHLDYSLMPPIEGCPQYSGETRTGSLLPLPTALVVDLPAYLPTDQPLQLWNNLHRALFPRWVLPNYPSKRSLIASTWLLWRSLLLCQGSFGLVHLITLRPMCSRTRWLWTTSLLLPNNRWWVMLSETLSIQPSLQAVHNQVGGKKAHLECVRFWLKFTEQKVSI